MESIAIAALYVAYGVAAALLIWLAVFFLRGLLGINLLFVRLNNVEDRLNRLQNRLQEEIWCNRKEIENPTRLITQRELDAEGAPREDASVEASAGGEK